ncbi:helix-hairpin-helix domain-containing protein [Paenibacillus chibensis]|uniref:Helix-hairpin-helix domain-containing protein n=1 Tax=Paenibacillus chibensis TaxID=59846 RepID=A0ABU6PSQ5_9BACL|nr:helix-hairpin-helix domain-containing protein [Paenibacillus chibensis]
MSKQPAPKLPLIPVEKARLRSSKIRLNEIAGLDVLDLAAKLAATPERASYLRALAQFQAVPSIGPRVADRVAALGYRSLEELMPLTGPDLLEQLENHFGFWEDPCLEDALWCMVHHANHPDSERCWFDFTEARKAFREKYGYPETRPKTAWHEVKSTGKPD